MLFFMVGCNNNKSNIQNLENSVAAELQSIDEGYDDETLKALSVILRTNLSLKKDNKLYSKKINPKYTKIAKSTKNETLKNDNNEIVEISLENTDSYHWQKIINKSEILDYAYKNNISLTNISSFEPVYENNKIKQINIAGKTFDYKTLAKEFNLESNEIENFEIKNSSVIITGKKQGFYDYFDFEKSKKLSKEGKNYQDILSENFSELHI